MALLIALAIQPGCQRRAVVAQDGRTDQRQIVRLSPDELRHAVTHGELDRMTEQLDLGVDPSTVISGLSLLHWAALAEQPKMAELLITRGANMESRRKLDGRTPLSWAVSGAEPDAALVFIRHGADVNAADVDGLRPLHWAAEHGHAALVSALIEHGADVNCTAWGSHDWTPLHYAAYHGNLAVARLLVDAGTATDTRAADGKTPNDVAQQEGHSGLRELLASE